MALEEQTIFFYQRFADRFTGDIEASKIRMTLVKLYMGRELYGNAVRAYSAELSDRRVSRQDQIKAALAIMYTEERYGEPKHAIWGAQKARELSGKNPQVLAEVLAFDVRQASAKNDHNRLKQLEGELSRLGSQDLAATEGLAGCRYVLANKEAEQIKQEIFNLEQTDPYGTLKAQYSLFLKSKASYEKVCAAGASSFCGPAMLRLAEASRSSLASIENLTIPQTLDEAEVNRFQKEKIGMISVVSKTSAHAASISRPRRKG